MPCVNADVGRLLIVLCPERSGSTLLAMILGGHHSIIAPPEMHMLRFHDYDTWRARYPKAFASLSWLLDTLDQPSTLTDVEHRFAGRETLDIYRELLDLCGPKRILVDKTPAYARENAVMARVEVLEPFYIWLVRHPLAVAASMLQRRAESYADRHRRATRTVKKAKLAAARIGNWLGDKNGANLRQQVERWCSVHTRVEAFLEAVPPERSLKVHYEQLVSRPEQEVARISTALGLTVEPAMLYPRENAPKVLEWDLGDQQVLQHSGIEASTAHRWREQFGDRALDRRTCEIMQRIGVVQENS